MITLKNPIMKPTDGILFDAGTYRFAIDKIEAATTKEHKKQSLKVTFKAVGGLYDGAQIMKTYSIEDNVGNNEFGQLTLAIDQKVVFPIQQIDEAKYLRKEVMLTLTVEDRKDGKGKANQIARGGYAPYEAGQASTAHAAPAAPAAVATTDDWDK